MLIFEHITSGYGSKRILNDISFSVNKGDVILIKGGNGSGKSTILKCIYGLLKPWNKTGHIIYNHREISGMPPSNLLRLGLAYMPQKKNVFELFSTQENLLISANIYSKAEANKRIQNVYQILPMLKKLQHRTPFCMSGGEHQLLALGIILIHSPQLALLDEPFAGADSANSEIIRKNIIDLINRGTTLLIVEHKHTLLEDIVNKVIEVELGTIKTYWKN